MRTPLVATVLVAPVTAFLDLGLRPEEGNLRVLRDGELVATVAVVIGAA